MATTKVRTLSSISEDYLRVLSLLSVMSQRAAAASLGQAPEDLPEMPGDITDAEKIKEAFPDKELDKMLDAVGGNDAEVGTLTDLQIIAMQSDMIARTRRAMTARYTDRSVRRLQSAFRRQRHAGEQGFWFGYKLAKVQSTLQRAHS